MTKSSTSTRVGLALAGCATMVLAACSSGQESPGAEGPEQQVLLGAGDSRLPNSTANEVVTFADHVVIAEAVSEQALPVPKEDIERGEGIILRDVTFKVSKTLWSNSTGRPVPEFFTWISVGWRFKDSVDNRSIAGYEESPRYDVGHTYVLALDWADDICGDGKAGAWDGLGGGFNMPYEQGVIGVGEFEGQSISKDEVAKTAPTEGVRADVWGKDLSALSTELTSAKVDAALAQQIQDADADC